MYRHKPRIVKQSSVVGSEKMAIEKRWEDCYNRSWRSKCYCVGACFSCIGAWVTSDRPCPALLFASMLLSYHVFLALTSSFFFQKKLFLLGNRTTPPSRFACQLPFQGGFFLMLQFIKIKFIGTSSVFFLSRQDITIEL